MSSNSLHIKGLNLGSSPKKPAFLCQSIFKSNIAERERESSSRAKYRLRQRCLQIFLIVFCSVLGSKVMAQTGNSCSNPYVMNLTNGSGNQVFNLNSSDTLLYVKIAGLANKTQLGIDFDTLALNYYLKDIRVTYPSCNNQLIIMQKNYFARFLTFESSVNSLGIDTVLLALSLGRLTDTLLYQNTINIRIKLINIYVPNSELCVNPVECNNLLPNGSFEEFNPPSTSFSTIPNLYPFFTSYVCSWDDEEQTADYFSPWFNSGCYQYGPQNICNSQGLDPNLSNSPFACGYPPQGSNFFANSESYSALQFGDNGASGGNISYQSEVLKGELSIPLVVGKKYYFEVDIAKPRRQQYGGRLDFNLSSNSNFVQNDYLSATPVTLSVDAFDYDTNLNWRRENTIYETQNVGEKFLYIGNLRLNPINAMPSANPFPTCSNFGGAVYYLFDNLVVKEFFADAGDASIIACTGAEIGGVSCPFPNGTYEWLPANLFANNTLYHPTFIGTSNATVSLTVSILMEDGTTQVSDPSYVNITIGPTVSIFGGTSVISGNNTTLNALGASTYTWYDNTGIVGTGASFTTPNLTQTTTYNVVGVNANGCSAEATVTVTVTTFPPDCTDLPNVITIPDGADETWFINYPGLALLNPLSSGQYVINQKNFFLSGQVNLSSVSNLKFSDCFFDFFDASEIINNGFLYLESCKLVACNNMWKGIQNNFGLTVAKSYFEGAQYAIHLKNQSRYKITGTTFENNLYGILMGEIGQTSTINGYDNSNVFKNPLPLKQQYLNMQDWMLWSEAGIRIESLDYVQIGQEIASTDPLSYSNKFHNINTGILITNTDVKVVNSMFYSIIPLILRTIPPFLKYDGCAIYTQSTANPKKLIVNPIPNYTGHEFANCTEGIKTNVVSLNAVKLSLNNIFYGIQCFNSDLCIHAVNENKINAKLKGIEISGAGFANSVNVNTNIINITNSVAITGISVTATQLGISSNVNIKFNEVTAGRTTINGIHASKLVSPTILCNTVKKFNNSSQYSQFVALNGFNISGCVGANLTTNYMQWAGATSTANNGNDYLVTASPQCNLICNYSGVSNVGFKISNPCPDLIFRRNKIGSHNIGLLYDGTANTGSQPANPSLATEGNKWLGAYSIWGAQNMAVPQNVQGSRYFYHPSQITINRPPNNSWDPGNWFDLSTTTFIQPDCTNGPCILTQIAKPNNIDYYKAIANGSITTVDYPAQTKWMAQSYLINLLGSDSILRNEDDSLRYFYFAPESNALRTMSEIDAKNNNFDATSKLISHSVYANDSLLNILSQNMTLQLSDTLMPDSVFYDLSINLHEQYAFINRINESFSNDIFTLLDENLNQAKEINDTLQSTNANETILQTINDMYYRFHQSKYLEINEEDSTMIAFIAHLCPLAAGPAVYQARDLYTLLVDSVVYNDSVKCAMQGYVREELAVFEPKSAIQKRASAYFKAYPVPSKHAVELQFSELNSEANLSVFNIQGQLMFQTTIPRGLSKFNLDIEAYSEGVYQVLLVNNQDSKRSKICKIK
jgi:hypothetical protein